MNSYNVLTDAELLTLLRQGDEKAFGCIYDRYWNSIYQACYNRMRDREYSRDIVQNVFMSLWDKRGAVEIENLSAYLHTAVKFQVLRLSGRSARTEFVANFETIVTTPVDKNHLIEEREILRLLRLFIDALPARRRAIFIKHYYESYSTGQIAEEFGISKKTVLNQINNAEAALKMRLAHLLTLSMIAGFWLKN